MQTIPLMEYKPRRDGSVFSAMIWMFLISLMLFWLPVAGPLIAGIVGGRMAGNVRSAVWAVFLPAFVIGALFFIGAAMMTGIPLIGFVAGFGGFILTIAHVGPLLLGAIVGGFMSDMNV
jgi:hypothetical protein